MNEQLNFIKSESKKSFLLKSLWLICFYDLPPSDPAVQVSDTTMLSKELMPVKKINIKDAEVHLLNA